MIAKMGLLITGIWFLFGGAYILLGAEPAIHEIEALVSFGIAAIFISGGVIKSEIKESMQKSASLPDRPTTQTNPLT